MRLTCTSTDSLLLRKGFFIFRKILKIYLINTDFYLQHSSQWEARVSSGISSFYCSTGGVFVVFGTVVVLWTPDTALTKSTLAKWGSTIVCARSLFTYKRKLPLPVGFQMPSGTEQHNHGGYVVSFLIELFGKAEFGTKRFNCTFSKPFFGRAFYLTKKIFVYNNVVLFFLPKIWFQKIWRLGKLSPKM